MLKDRKMQKKIEVEQPDDNFFQQLPLDLIKSISDEFLNIKHKAILAQTYTGLNNFFVKNLAEAKANRILELVAQGNQDGVEKLIRETPELLTMRTKIIDWTGRTFQSISPWEYALWALDTRYMANMMLDCIPKGESIRDKLLSQYLSLEKKGVTYEVDGVTITESHFDFQPLINSIEFYNENMSDWANDERKKQWVNVVGGEQRKLPVHIRQHYCDPNSPFGDTDGLFQWDIPDFKGKFTRSLDLATPSVKWCPTEDCGLGVDYAIVRSVSEKPICSTGQDLWILDNTLSMCISRQVDILALKQLHKVRMDDYTNLKEKLETLFENEIQIEPSNSSCVMM